MQTTREITMEFKKYSSIENHYRQKYIDKHEYFLHDTRWCVTEKIHGANFCVLIENGNVEFAKRTSIIKDNEKFYNFKEAVNSIMPNLTFAIDSIADNDKVRIWGELCGDGVQKGIYYSDTKQLLFFDVEINGVRLCQERAFGFLDSVGLPTVPLLGIYDSFNEAMAFDTKIDSVVSGKSDNEIEGVVIKPYDKVLTVDNLSFFSIKKKNDKFMEVKAKTQKVAIPDSDNVAKLKEDFARYLTKNRVANVMSKKGEIESPKDIRRYVGLVTKDAIEDFMPTIDPNTDKKDLKKVWSIVGKIIVPMITEYL